MCTREKGDECEYKFKKTYFEKYLNGKLLVLLNRIYKRNTLEQLLGYWKSPDTFLPRKT